MTARHLTSLPTSLPHRRRDVRRVLPPALLVLLLVQTLFAPPLTHAQVGSASPGKLAAPHARLEGTCDACHVRRVAINSA